MSKLPVSSLTQPSHQPPAIVPRPAGPLRDPALSIGETSEALFLTQAMSTDAEATWRGAVQGEDPVHLFALLQSDRFVDVRRRGMIESKARRRAARLPPHGRQ